MAPKRTSLRVKKLKNAVESLEPTNCGSNIQKGTQKAKAPRPSNKIIDKTKKSKQRKKSFESFIPQLTSFEGRNLEVVDLTCSLPYPDAMDFEEIPYPSSLSHVTSIQNNILAPIENVTSILGPDDKFIFLETSDSDDSEILVSLPTKKSVAKPTKKKVTNKNSKLLLAKPTKESVTKNKNRSATNRRTSRITNETNEVLVIVPTENETNEVLDIVPTENETNEVLVIVPTENESRDVLVTSTTENKPKLVCPPKKYNFEDSSDSSDSDCEVAENMAQNNYNRANYNFKDFDSDEDDNTDLYSTNYNAERVEAFQIVEDTLKSSAILKEAKSSSNIFKSTTIPGENDLLCDQSSFVSDSPNKEPQTPSYLNISLVELKSSAKPRTTKKSKQALASLKSFSQRYHADLKATESSNLDSTIDDLIAVSDDECSEVKVKIRWGTSYIKLPIRKDQKFIVLYQQLAEKHNVNVSQVVLSYKDRVLYPDVPFLDYDFNVADILDGGIISNQTNSDAATEVINKGKDMIELKLQSVNKKDSTTVTVGKYDKLSIIMQNYAESSKVPIDKLKFCFDGDTIKPSDTAMDLDLEGGECIDVFII